jgi:hypothetical protein
LIANIILILRLMVLNRHIKNIKHEAMSFRYFRYYTVAYAIVISIVVLFFWYTNRVIQKGSKSFLFL